MSGRVDDIAIEILSLLRHSPDKRFSVAALAEKFSTKPKFINEALRGLVVWGYKFEFDSKSDVQFVSAPDAIFPHEIEYHLKTKFIGRNIVSHFSIPSTNTHAFSLADEGAVEGTMVIAEKQTAGKGRLGRKWNSPAKSGLWFSLVLRPTLPPSELPGLSIMTAAALASSIRSRLDLDAMIKWPNDVLIDDSKVAGILTEMAAELDKARHVIVGVGINVNQHRKDFPANLRNKATSLLLESGDRIDRIKFLADFLLTFENLYLDFKKKGLKPLLPKIRKMSSLIGNQVRLKKGRKTILARAVDIDSSGALVVKRKKELMRVTAGEVTII